MRPLARSICVGSASLIIGACTTFGVGATIEHEDEDENNAPLDEDGGRSEDPSLRAPAPDASRNCRLLVLDDFSDVDASLQRWRLLGDTKIENGEVELTPRASSKRGAIWMEVDAGNGELDVRFTSRITDQQGTPPADGLSFVWSESRRPGLGGAGGELAVCDVKDGGIVDGVAFSLSSYRSRIELFDVRGACPDLQGASIPSTKFDVVVLGERSLSFATGKARVVGSIGTEHFDLESPRDAGNIRAIGFAAATGLYYARHVVDDVRVMVCDD